MKKLLWLMEAGGYGQPAALLHGSTCELKLETSTRRAMALMKSWQPDILVADFYKRYFHDRVSNLESMLAVASRNPSMRIVVIHDPFHAADVALLGQRHRIDVLLPLPVSATALAAALG